MATEMQQRRVAVSGCVLLGLPEELLSSHILSLLDARSLATLDTTCSFFSAGKTTCYGLTEQAAMHKLTASCGSAEASRFKGLRWKQRLRLEECLAGFDPVLLQRAGLTVVRKADGAINSVSLQNRLGPKLLVSDWGTFDRPVLRWRLRVRGNMAVEFGVVPSFLASNHTALHKDVLHNKVPARRRGTPVGFCSLTTGGSTLPFKAPVFEGCIVEIAAQRDHVQYIITNPPHTVDSLHESIQVPGNNAVLLYPSRVPKEMRLQHDILPDFDYRLALTCWANGSFEVIPSFRSAEQLESASTINEADTNDSVGKKMLWQGDTMVVLPGGNVHQTDFIQ